MKLLPVVVVAASIAATLPVSVALATNAPEQPLARACDFDPDLGSANYATDPPATEGGVDDPEAAWLTNDESQTAIDAFWLGLAERNVATVGAVIDFDLHRMVVVLDPLTDMASAQEFLAELTPIVQVELAIGCAAKADIETAQDSIDEALSSGELGLISSVIRVNPLVPRVEVTVRPTDVEVATAAVQRLENDLIIVKNSPTLPSFQVRCGDLPAHYGGANYKQGNASNCTSTCTSGFKVRKNSNGIIGMSTAGHCRVLTGWSGDLYSKTSFFGEFLNWSFGGQRNRDDWGFIGTSTYSTTFYTDPCCPNTRVVAGTGQASVGTALCLSGAVTTARCSMIVTDVSVTICDNNSNCALNVEAQRSDGDLSCQDGDSGAPWYRPTNSYIYGIHSAGSSFGDICYYNAVARMVGDGYTVLTG